jgi:hypothetical protein
MLMSYFRNNRNYRRESEPQRTGSFGNIRREPDSFRDDRSVYGNRNNDYPLYRENLDDESDYYDEYLDDEDRDYGNEWDRSSDREYDRSLAEYDDFDDYEEDADYIYHAYDDFEDYDEYNPHYDRRYLEQSAGASYNNPYGYRRAGQAGTSFYGEDSENYPRNASFENRRPEYRSFSPRYEQKRYRNRPHSNEWRY